MIVIHLLALFSPNLPFYGSFQAVRATAGERIADLDAIHRGHEQTSRPRGGEHLIALQLPGNVTAQGEDLVGVLSLQNVADGVFTEWTNAVAQRALAAFTLDAMDRAELAGAAQENGSQDLLCSMIPVASPIRQSRDAGGPIEHLIEPNLELVSGQAAAGLAFLRLLSLLLTLQQAAQIDFTDGIGGLLKTFMELYPLAGIMR